MATTSPIQGLPVETAVENPATAPMSIIPLDAEVQDPGPLGEDLADRREEQDGAAGDAGGQDQREVHQAGAAALRGPIRTR